MRTVYVHFPAFPNHRIKRRGHKYHAFPIDDEDWRHRAHRNCRCNPVAIGPTSETGHGLWLHINKPRNFKWEL